MKYPWGSLEESLSIISAQRHGEIDFLRTIVFVSAIIQTGNRICAAVTGSEIPAGDNLTKNIEALEKLLLPHRKEEREAKAGHVKKILEREAAGGILKYKVVGGDNSKRNRQVIRLRRKDAL